MKDEMEKIKNQYEKFQKEYNKKNYNDYAKVIVGFKIIKHVVFKLPKAMKEKNFKSENNNENPLYKNKSIFDYIEEPEFEYNDEVERISEKIEQKMNKTNSTIKSIRQKTNPFFWIKKIIHGIRKKDTKLLTEGNNAEDEINKKSKFEETRHNFVNSLKSSSFKNEIKIKDRDEKIKTNLKLENENYR